MSAGRGACDGAVGNANTDAGGRGVAVAERSVLAEVDSRGTGVGYSSVVGGKVGWVRGGWAVGQGDNKSNFVDRLE